MVLLVVRIMIPCTNRVRASAEVRRGTMSPSAEEIRASATPCCDKDDSAAASTFPISRRPPLLMLPLRLLLPGAAWMSAPRDKESPAVVALVRCFSSAAASCGMKRGKVNV